MGWRKAASRTWNSNFALPRNPQVFVQNSHSIYGSDRPNTQQSRGCGEPGDHIALPYQFLTAWNNTWERFGDPAKLFIKEWSKLRYGIFDEFGFDSDPLYPSFFKWNGQVVPTGTTDAHVNGQWLNEKEQRCNPQIESKCYFFPIGSNDQVTCSIGYLHHLPR